MTVTLFAHGCKQNTIVHALTSDFSSSIWSELNIGGHSFGVILEGVGVLRTGAWWVVGHGRSKEGLEAACIM